MLTKIWSILTIAGCLMSPSAQAFELDKYLGLWHEVYSIPNSFQKNCFNVTAEYSLKPSKDIKVINTCRDSEGNVTKSIEGEAVVKDLSKRYLKVYFFRPFGLNLFGGDYYILALEENYKWALVGTPDHKYGWILSRDREISIDNLEKIKQELTTQGFTWDQFKKTQSN